MGIFLTFGCYSSRKQIIHYSQGETTVGSHFCYMMNRYSQTLRIISMITLIAFSFTQVALGYEGFLRGEQVFERRLRDKTSASATGIVSGGAIFGAMIELIGKIAKANNEVDVRDALSSVILGVLGFDSFNYYSVKKNEHGAFMIKNELRAGDSGYSSAEGRFVYDEGEKGRVLRYFEEELKKSEPGNIGLMLLYYHSPDRRLETVNGGFGYSLGLATALEDFIHPYRRGKRINGTYYESLAFFIKDSLKHTKRFKGAASVAFNAFWPVRIALNSCGLWQLDKSFTAFTYIILNTFFKNWGTAVREVLYMPVVSHNGEIIGLVLVHNWQSGRKLFTDSQDKIDKIDALMHMIQEASFSLSKMRSIRQIRKSRQELERLFYPRRLLHDLKGRTVAIALYSKWIPIDIENIYKDIYGDEYIGKVGIKIKAAKIAYMQLMQISDDSSKIMKHIDEIINKGTDVYTPDARLIERFDSAVENMLKTSDSAKIVSLFYEAVADIFAANSVEEVEAILARVSLLEAEDPFMMVHLGELAEFHKRSIVSYKQANSLLLKIRELKSYLDEAERKFEDMALASEQCIRSLEIASDFSELGIEDQEKEKIKTVKDYMAGIHEEMKRLKTLIRKFTSFHKTGNIWEAVFIDEKDITKNIWDSYSAVRALAEKESIKVSNFNNDSIIKMVMLVDGDMIFSVVNNMMFNAVNYSKAHPGPGESEPEGGRNIYMVLNITEHDGRQYLRVLVKDTGIGIPADKQDVIGKLGERAGVYERYGREGTGTGVAGIISDMKTVGGIFSFRSKEGVGSEFWVELPFSEPLSKEDADRFNREVDAKLKQAGIELWADSAASAAGANAGGSSAQGESLYEEFIQTLENIQSKPVEVSEAVQKVAAELLAFKAGLTPEKAIEIYTKIVSEYAGGVYAERDPNGLLLSNNWNDVFNNKMATLMLRIKLKQYDGIVDIGKLSLALHYLKEQLESGALTPERARELFRDARAALVVDIQVSRNVIAVIVSDNDHLGLISNIRDNLTKDRGVRPENIIEITVQFEEKLVISQIEELRRKNGAEAVWMINNTGLINLGLSSLGKIIFVPDELFNNEMFKKKVEAALTGSAM